ncbi:DUF2568 domain-containing protein [Glutamicibacter nicotianae]|uniref:DUF2568 domain-containing protein n=1 Tax=Glutamicibacter nicotianae TaxID=37929 RepID=UPI0019576199|nr:DUF2568 domain-containing protein [Glutamicibacter nicotianae]MBM7768075.1 FtsH-binding integral membrane protein [Glutamicibacter nicotianae]
MGKKSSQRVSPFLSATYAAVAFLLEVGLLFAAALAAIAFIPWPTIPAILVVVIPLLILWSIFFSPKAVIKLRLRTRLLLIHIIYLIGAYVLWLSVDHSFYDQSQIWAIGMLSLTGISAILVLATGGYVVPHDRTKKPERPLPNRARTGAPKGRRAAR